MIEQTKDISNLFKKFVDCLLMVISFLVISFEHGSVTEEVWQLSNLKNQTSSKNFSFEHEGYCFLWMFGNYTDQIFHNFYRACYKFWTIYAGF